MKFTQIRKGEISDPKFDNDSVILDEDGKLHYFSHVTKHTLTLQDSKNYQWGFAYAENDGSYTITNTNTSKQFSVGDTVSVFSQDTSAINNPGASVSQLNDLSYENIGKMKDSVDRLYKFTGTMPDSDITITSTWNL